MRAFGVALLGLGMIASAMGQRATDSSFELEEDASFTLGTGSPSSGAWILPHNSANWASTYKAICDADAQMVSCGEYAQGNLGIYHLIINNVGGGTASNTAECAAALGASSGFKTLLNDQDAGYDPTIFIGFNPHNINGNTPGCMVGVISNGFSTTSPVSDANVYVAQRAYYWDLHADFGNILTGVNPNGGSLPEEYEIKAYKAIPCAGGCGGGGGSSCVTGGDGDFSLNEAAYCTCDNDCISGSCVNDECTAPAPNTNCLNSLGLRILGAKCGCDDDCAGANNVCLDSTCVPNTWSSSSSDEADSALDTAVGDDNTVFSESQNTRTLTMFSGKDSSVKQILRRNLARKLKTLGGAARDFGMKVSFASLALDAGDGKSFIEDLMTARGKSDIIIRPPKDKSAYTLGDTDTAACAAADFTESDTDVVECTHTEDGDVCLRCDDNALVSKTVFNADTNDYSVYCHDGSAWGTAATKSAGETYTCSLNDKTYESAIFSETGGGGSTAICVEVGQRVLMSDGTHKNVEHLVPGDVLRTPEGITTVRSTRRGGRHLSQVHDVECAGQKGSITGNHAYHCEGEWRLAQETHEPRALTGTTEVVAVETDNYCEDRMILEGGLHVETWDGRGINEWRPHSFENGRRLRCTLKGSWRDQVLQRMDSKQ